MAEITLASSNLYAEKINASFNSHPKAEIANRINK